MAPVPGWISRIEMRQGYAGRCKKYYKESGQKRKRRRKIYAGLALLAVLVAGFVSWKLILPGIALGGDAYCGMEEHTHSGACYEEVLICGQEESAGHTHTEACYTERAASDLRAGGGRRAYPYGGLL